MTEFKGTPGPWNLSRTKRFVKKEYGAPFVCEIDAGNKQWEANAALIAAAPELLEALAELVGIIDGAVKDDRSAALKLQIDSFTCQPARAAIAKALGESQ